MVLDHGRAPKWSFINWLAPIRIWLTLARTLYIGHSFIVWWLRATAREVPQMCGNIAEMHPKQINRKQSKHDRPPEKDTSWQNCWSKQNRVLVINDTLFQRIPTLAETSHKATRQKAPIGGCRQVRERSSASLICKSLTNSIPNFITNTAPNIASGYANLGCLLSLNGN